MTVKNVVSAQYKIIVDRAAVSLSRLTIPPEGWVCTVRKALEMSVSQLAARLGVTRSLISRTENQELTGSVSLKTMQKIAEAMGCRFVYAIVPEKKIDDLILQQAKLRAKEIVNKTNVHMALEKQLLRKEILESEIERLAQEIIKENLSDLWNTGLKSKK